MLRSGHVPADAQMHMLDAGVPLVEAASASSSPAPSPAAMPPSTPAAAANSQHPRDAATDAPSAEQRLQEYLQQSLQTVADQDENLWHSYDEDGVLQIAENTNGGTQLQANRDGVAGKGELQSDALNAALKRVRTPGFVLTTSVRDAVAGGVGDDVTPVVARYRRNLDNPIFEGSRQTLRQFLVPLFESKR